MTTRISKAAARRMGIKVKPGRSKYGAVRTTIDGHNFDSKKEGTRYLVLKSLVAAGEITDLELQPKFDLHALGGKKIGTYRPDFKYAWPRTGKIVFEDVKGMRTPLFNWKLKHVEAEYGIVVLLT